MSYAELLDRARREGILISALLELTYRCGLDCEFCYNDRARSDRPLSTAQWQALIRGLSELGVLHLAFSGGEPLEHPAFFDLGRLARSLEMVVRVKSNGMRLDAPRARRLREEVDPFAVDISIHGASATTHDRLTNRPGSFARLRRNLDAMLAAGLRLRLTTVLTAWNEGELDAMRELASSLGLVLSVAPEVSPRDDGDRTPLALLPSVEGLTRLNERLQEGVRTEPACTGLTDRGPICGAASSSVAVDPFGNVLPCVEWRDPIGNLHEEPIARIWQPERCAAVRAITTEARARLETPAGGGLPLWFCPAAARRVAGDPLRLYPGAEHRIEAERRARSRCP